MACQPRRGTMIKIAKHGKIRRAACFIILIVVAVFYVLALALEDVDNTVETQVSQATSGCGATARSKRLRTF